MKKGLSFYNEQDPLDVDGLNLFEDLQREFDKEHSVLRSPLEINIGESQ